MARWKKSLDEINKEILNLFPNFKNGTNILQATLTQQSNTTIADGSIRMDSG